MLRFMENFDIFIYAVVAILVIARLRSVLGRRDEDEADDTSRPDPFASPKETKPSATDEEDVMILEGRARPAPTASVLTPQGHAPMSLAGTLDQFRLVDHTFDEKKFLDGAKLVFAKIVECFAAGDLSPVVRFLGPAVRGPFEKAIEARKAAGQTLENRMERLAAADIVAARIENTVATLSVEFVSHQVNVLRDASGQILDGDPGRAEEVRDLWTFRRDLRSPDPNWQLVETRS